MTVDLNDTYIKRWLTGLSEGTKETYPPLLEDWLTFIGMTPTEQINKRMHDSTSTDVKVRFFFEDQWKAYKQSLEATGTYSDSKVHDRIKVVSSFFTRNNLPLSLARGDWQSTQKQQVKERKAKLTLDDIKRMYNHANLNEKCLLLILAQSGFSETDIEEQRIEQIKGLYEMPQAEHYVIEKPRDKNTHVQATCLSYEFLHDLRDLLAEKGNPTTGYIFTSQTKGKDVEHIKKRRIAESMKALAEKTWKDSEKGQNFETRQLRSFYNSALLRAKIQPQEIKDLMMGQQVGGARGHYSYDEETIIEAYSTAFEYLSINGIQSREDMAKIKADLQAIIGKQQVQIENQNNKMDELSERFENLQKLLNNIYFLNRTSGKPERVQRIREIEDEWQKEDELEARESTEKQRDKTLSTIQEKPLTTKERAEKDKVLEEYHKRQEDP